jgi:hypothetical protein
LSYAERADDNATTGEVVVLAKLDQTNSPLTLASSARFLKKTVSVMISKILNSWIYFRKCVKSC